MPEDEQGPKPEVADFEQARQAKQERQDKIRGQQQRIKNRISQISRISDRLSERFSDPGKKPAMGFQERTRQQILDASEYLNELGSHLKDEIIDDQELERLLSKLKWLEDEDSRFGE